MCVNFRKKTECVLTIGIKFPKSSTWKGWHVRHLRPGFPNDKSEPVNPPLSPPLPFPPFPPPPRPSLENVEFSAGNFDPGRNLRSTKTLKAEISGRKLLRPKPLESVPQFSSPSLSNKAGWTFTVNCSRINSISHIIEILSYKIRQEEGHSACIIPALTLRASRIPSPRAITSINYNND